MLKVFNSMGKRYEDFQPVDPTVVNMFTCGPSIYQRAHIGNFRTFLFEDILVRYLEFSGWNVKRGMNITDIEDKAVREAGKRRTTVKELTSGNVRQFISEMKLLGMKIPDYLPRASESVAAMVEIIEELLKKGIAYRHEGGIFFDPLKVPGFGRLYGLDMSRWPNEKRRFHLDTYSGDRWNLGDFILWHGYREGEPCWDTSLGKGRPSWNVQDAGMVLEYFHDTLSFYMGGIDNLIRHHDYTIAILESVRPYPLAKYWLHCHHLLVNGRKMSKSRGNILYTEDLKKKGYSAKEIRFFLIYNHYRETISYSDRLMKSYSERLRQIRKKVRSFEDIPGTSEKAQMILDNFSGLMDKDLYVRGAVDRVFDIIAGMPSKAQAREAAGVVAALKRVDFVLNILF